MLPCLLWPTCNFNANIAIIVFGFINPIPNADFSACTIFRGKFILNPIFLNVTDSCIFINISSCFGVNINIPQRKYTFFIKHMLKKHL